MANDDLKVGGFFTGLDTTALINTLLQVQRGPITALETRKKALDVKSTALTAIKNSLSTLQTKIANLKTASFFSSKAATPSDTTVLSSTADSTAVSNTYAINITALATGTALKSGTALGPAAEKVANSIDPTALVGADTSYGNSLSTGTFTVNGATVTITAASTLNTILADIAAAPNIASATYNAATDTIDIAPTGGNTVFLGGASDTSDFLSRSRLYSTGTVNGTVSSLTSLGTVDTSQDIFSAASRFVNSGTVTAGDFTVNGVTITVAAGDSLNTVMGNITASAAGVYASYDSVEDRLVLTSKTTGTSGITATDGTSNFASSFKLTTTTSQTALGTNTTFTVNGNSRVSSDNVISATESGIVGVTMTALKAGAGAITLTVGADTSKISDEVKGFVDQYNAVQALIDTYTNTPTEATKSTDSASILAGDSFARQLPTNLRSDVTGAYGSGTFRMLQEMGVTSSTTSSNRLLTFDSTALKDKLTTNFSDVQTVFTSAMTGLDDFVKEQVKLSTGVIADRTENIDSQKKRIDVSIAAQENRLAGEKKRLEKAFSLMEQYQAKSNNVLSFLNSKKDA